MRGLRRIAIVNRGEAAMRLVNAVRELRVERGEDIRTIALHTPAERTAMFVREADEAVVLDGTYLDMAALERALVAARADAAWVGWGFVAERPEFAALCDTIGVTFVGPSADVMRRLGDKIEAKRLAEEAAVPVAAWSGGPVDSLEDARVHAAAIGYPLMIKATSGGGGRGIRRVDDDAGLAEAFDGARSEGLKAFGDATVFMERVVTGARHVEVQLIADEHGTAWAVGVRDCSMQRRNQKVIEESACPVLTPAQDAELRAAAVRLARAAGYVNAGTVEFLYQPAEQRFAFLEVNTRLQVEHPVTELTTGLDLVKLQLHVAAGGRLEGEPPATEGYAIEARLNAEDPQRGFTPAPGTIEILTLPVGPGIRVDTGVGEGDVIPPEYDSMIAKVIAHGRDRGEALARLHRALSQLTVVVRGGTTNRAFLLDLLERPEVRAGDIDTSWLDRLTAADGHLPTRLADVGLIVAALDAGDLLLRAEVATFLGWAARGRPQADTTIGRTIELRHGGRSSEVFLRQLGPQRFSVALDGAEVVVDVERLGRARSRLTIGGHTYGVVSSVQGSEHLVEVDGVAHRYSRDDAGVVRAPAAALVVAVDVAPGDLVDAGARLGVVEAMKMEIGVPSPIAGRVRDVFVARNVQVDAGAPLFRIEPAVEHGDSGPEGPTIDLRGLGSAPYDGLSVLQALVLGYDVDVAAAQVALADVVANPDERGQLAVVDTFADLAAVAPERRDPGADDERAPREHLHSYLRSLDLEHEGLPAWFGDELARALARFGVADLEGGPAMEAALLRIFVAEQRRPEQLPIVMGLLDATAAVSAEGSPELRESLDRLIERTRRRYPEVAALARNLRYRRFDRPYVERARAATSATMRRLAVELAGARPERDRIDELVACPLPLVPILAEDGLFGSTPTPGGLIEVLVRRYYKIRQLGPVTRGPDGVVRASYEHRDRTVHVLAARVDDADLVPALGAVRRHALGIAGPATAVADLFLTRPATDGADSDALAEDLAAALAFAGLPSAVRRVSLVASHPLAGTEVLTFRRAPGDEHFVEDETFRGLHPMIARRLQLWRLANFDITRVGTTGDVNVFDCVGRDNRSDERLIAVAEVRDLTPVRDEQGRAIALPEVEGVLVACLDAIRQAGVEQPARRRLEWNRVMLYVWPPIDLPLDEVWDIARRLTPLTEGLGLEQVVVSGRLAQPDGGEPVETVMRMGFEPGRGLNVRLTPPPDAPMQPLDDYTRKLIQSRRRGLVYPYELFPMLAGDGGSFVEHDLDDAGALVPVDRPAGLNKAGVVVGVVRTPTERYPEGMARVAVLGDPTRAMGSITEDECRRVLGAIDLAASMGAPIEWFALSAGAKIAMDSGSENLDWVARVLRRLVEHTQAGGEVNVVVAGINVGAQPYWNAESTMLMHTRGILVMTPDSAMVLTGKQAIDYSGGVSAEDNLGIGGYGRVMGPNGEAQYWAPSLTAACELLFQHYELTYRAPGERWPRHAPTCDPVGRDVRSDVHDIEGVEFSTVGDIFSAATNPDRKKPFDIRTLIAAVVDRDGITLERWPEMAEAETAVVCDTRIGGHGVTVIGIESRPLPRHGQTPADGPAQWSAGTLFPLSSKKVARAINAASGCRPVVVLANLSGFDGSPESLRRLQLEYGAEIGRAIVNFDGPIVLCVVSRYHGGAFVVFSGTLNDHMEVLAVEGSFASVIGGAPAAAVVFTRDVDERTQRDERVRTLEASSASPAEIAVVREAVRTEKLGEVAAEFDAVHSVQRAQDVGSVHRIIAAERLRPELAAAIERGHASTE
jgi:acetyl/propionyl-CoA carboxylase alpha subunit/acetyl-CoA carboxylase carboxyltransferase component